MDTFQAIKERRAVKHFDPDHKFTEAETSQLLNLAVQAPTAFNLQHWRIVNVADKALRNQIRKVSWDQAQVTDASLLLVICGDTKVWEKDPGRFWKDAPGPVAEFMIPSIEQYYKGREQVQRDEVMRSCGIIGQTLMLTAKAMGYDSCPMDGFDYDAVGELINLPEDHAIAMFVAIGKCTQAAWPKPGQLDLDEVIINDRF